VRDEMATAPEPGSGRRRLVDDVGGRIAAFRTRAFGLQ